MDVQPVNLGDELRQGFQLRLALAPVVICRPIAREFLHRRERHALGLICDGLLFGPLRGRDAATEVDEILFRNVDAEGAYCGMGLHRLCSSCRATGVISPAVLHNEVKCEVLEELAQLPRTPFWRSSR